MQRSLRRAALCLAAGGVVAGGPAFAQIGQAYQDGRRAGMDTLGQTYNGMGRVVASPFRDFGVMRARIPPPLQKAVSRPYDVAGITTCEKVREEVMDLDLVLGPDIDTPDIEKHRNMYNRGSEMVASTALDAVRSAANHFIPMRDTIRKISGAEQAQKKVDKAIVAGRVRRGFLKSYGMQHNCAWPAAPAAFRPAPGGPNWSVVQAKAALPPPPPPMTPAVIPAVEPVAPPPAATETQAGAWRMAAPAAVSVASAPGTKLGFANR